MNHRRPLRSDRPGGNDKSREFLYFFHPDHLGSTAYVTDGNAKRYQHLEYFPFGETFVEEDGAKWRTLYEYTAKTIDPEVQLYYYGARYYDPRTSVWQSADPILAGYINGSSNVGVFRPANLGLYSYGYNSPIVIKDPDGLFNEVGHHDVTYVILYLGGMPASVAGEMAKAAWAPDTDSRNAMSASSLAAYNLPIHYQQSIHLLNGGNPSTTKSRKDAEAAEILRNSYKEYLAKGTVPKLAKWQENALHSMGDARAHIDKSTGRYYEPGMGHAWDSIVGNDPDAPNTDPSAYLDYAGALFDMSSKITGTPRVSREEAMGVIQILTKIPNKDQQRLYLKAIMEQHGTVLPDPAPEY